MDEIKITVSHRASIEWLPGVELVRFRGKPDEQISIEGSFGPEDVELLLGALREWAANPAGFWEIPKRGGEDG